MSPTPSGTADALDRRCGEIAVREGLATEEQVEECLAIRQKLVRAGAQAKTLPEILLAKGYVTREGAKKLAAAAAEAAAPAGAPPVEAGPPRRPKIPGYEVMELLGRGGMGAVYKARQLSLDRIVALKVLSSEAARDESYVRRFMTEARALARLNHENIIAGIDVGEAGGVRYFAMEYVEGEPLSAIIEREGALPEKRVLKIGMQVARALAHAEKNGLVHRDVKPQNIMIGRNDVAKLCDLGLAMTADERKEARDRGHSIGTPHYISPEQARGEHKVDIRSDIYSLGATLYHAVTGETPFQGTSAMVLMTKHLTEDPPPAKKRRPGISKGLNDLIAKMMAKEKERRHQSPIELLEEMEKILAGRTPAGAPAAAAPERGTAPAKRGVAAGPATRAAAAAAGGGGAPAPKPIVYRPPVAGRNAPPADASLMPLIVTLAILVFGSLGALLVWKGSQASKPAAPPPPSAKEEQDARESLVNVTNAFNAGQIDKYEAIAKFRQIAGTWPRTEAAKDAEAYAKKVEAAPVKRDDEPPPDDE